ncbi:MAG: hypothetical protein GX587_06165 [Bacteroidales bacterium]|nr:hypothetical protein [Bacteroidales bacterium]
MKIANKVLWILMVLPFVFSSCSNSISEQLKTEMQKLKSQCPMDQGDGVIMTDVNFYENEKVLEYVCSVEGIEEIDETVTVIMKQAIVDALGSDLSTFESLSVKTILNEDYRFRYIYTNTAGKKLCEIDITKNDLP